MLSSSLFIISFWAPCTHYASCLLLLLLLFFNCNCYVEPLKNHNTKLDGPDHPSHANEHQTRLFADISYVQPVGAGVPVILPTHRPPTTGTMADTQEQQQQPREEGQTEEHLGQAEGKVEKKEVEEEKEEEKEKEVEKEVKKKEEEVEKKKEGEEEEEERVEGEKKGEEEVEEGKKGPGEYRYEMPQWQWSHHWQRRERRLFLELCARALDRCEDTDGTLRPRVRPTSLFYPFLDNLIHEI